MFAAHESSTDPLKPHPPGRGLSLLHRNSVDQENNPCSCLASNVTNKLSNNARSTDLNDLETGEDQVTAQSTFAGRVQMIGLSASFKDASRLIPLAMPSSSHDRQDTDSEIDQGGDKFMPKENVGHTRGKALIPTSHRIQKPSKLSRSMTQTTHSSEEVLRKLAFNGPHFIRSYSDVVFQNASGCRSEKDQSEFWSGMSKCPLLPAVKPDSQAPGKLNIAAMRFRQAWKCLVLPHNILGGSSSSVSSRDPYNTLHDSEEDRKAVRGNRDSIIATAHTIPQGGEGNAYKEGLVND
ncbi:hypothetical protein CEUSTIGMA_g4413.t1 [Chlamydomonas eustigma]|uniref:Uncharacterized protein n=1 Tax=Chlamydomonas eustigma TaxID=1157962 RepID=A0A250X1N4_9CHLO|nr:hypothetical protein CEUSTIGMA_g4413.t1 [Chlamydomonas eustigma]|eukprot:GAX76966.1 hypothetical protein CEUSTIGMA_g4413.t1 [Chlamydomonas eustigma]